MSREKAKVVTYRVLTRNGTKFAGTLSHRQSYEIWCDCFKLDGDLLHGISLVQAPGLPFLADFHLHEDINLNKLPETFRHLLEGATYQGEFLKDDFYWAKKFRSSSGKLDSD